MSKGDPGPTCRRFLQAAALAGVAGLAGCGAIPASPGRTATPGDSTTSGDGRGAYATAFRDLRVSKSGRAGIVTGAIDTGRLLCRHDCDPSG